MSTIPVNLPPELMNFVENKVGEGQFSSASDYLVALVDAARKSRSAIESALIEGIESEPAEEWADGEWQAIRNRVNNCRV